MTELEAIQKRHSVRRYLEKPIKKEHVDSIVKKIEELNNEGNLHMQFLEDASGTFNKLFNKAVGLKNVPSTILCIGKDEKDLDERVGYFGQKLVLYAQQLGLNTCWVGIFNRKGFKSELGEGERLVIAIAIGYGENQGKNRKCKSPEEVVDDYTNVPDWFKAGVEAALLAPTAINQQSFKIIYNKDGEVEFKDMGGILSTVDIGIVRCNFEIGANDYKSRYKDPEAL